MHFKTRNRTLFSKMAFLLVLVVLVCIIPVILTNMKNHYNTDLNNNILNENDLKTNEFTKENYTEILESETYGLGNITIDNIRFNTLELGFYNENIYHPLIIEDIISESLIINLTNMEFIETTSPAIVDNLNEEIEDKNSITIKLNETLFVQYNNSEQGYLVYLSRYLNAELVDFYVDNGTTITKLIEGTDYTIEPTHFLIFHYEDFFKQGSIFNFSMYLIWEFDIYVGDWKIEQNNNEFLEIIEVEQEITPEFSYSFFLNGWKYASKIPQSSLISDWDIAFTVNPLDKENFTDHILAIDGIEVNLGQHLNPDKSIRINLNDEFRPNATSFSLNFTTAFRLKFEESVEKSWAIDRLIRNRDIRERIYLCSLISGPRHIFLKYVVFYETSIYFEEVLDVYSLFERDTLFIETNSSITGQPGLNITIPFLFVGETCPVSIEYITFQKLKIIITDNIKMPLVNAKIELFYCGVTYGTYISNSTIQPIIPRRSDENGQIVVNNVPRGNYTIRIYYQGRFIEEAIVSTFKEVNYVYTEILHSPLWILIFGLINAVFLITGMIFYLKYKKLR
ncbi:MAG: hypothetical protein ACFFA0_09435 [Promethearchaeota archaeon]